MSICFCIKLGGVAEQETLMAKIFIRQQISYENAELSIVAKVFSDIIPRLGERVSIGISHTGIVELVENNYNDDTHSFTDVILKGRQDNAAINSSIFTGLGFDKLYSVKAFPKNSDLGDHAQEYSVVDRSSKFNAEKFDAKFTKTDV